MDFRQCELDAKMLFYLVAVVVITYFCRRLKETEEEPRADKWKALLCGAVPFLLFVESLVWLTWFALSTIQTDSLLQVSRQVGNSVTEKRGDLLLRKGLECQQPVVKKTLLESGQLEQFKGKKRLLWLAICVPALLAALLQ